MNLPEALLAISTGAGAMFGWLKGRAHVAAEREKRVKAEIDRRTAELTEQTGRHQVQVAGIEIAGTTLHAMMQRLEAAEKTVTSLQSLVQTLTTQLATSESLRAAEGKASAERCVALEKSVADRDKVIARLEKLVAELQERLGTAGLQVTAMRFSDRPEGK